MQQSRNGAAVIVVWQEMKGKCVYTVGAMVHREGGDDDAQY